MNKVSKNKGFSLIEILAAVVILGLLSSLAIVSVNYILKKAEKEYYKAQEDEIIAAAKSYTQDNRNALPKRVGMATYVKLSTLQSKKYIGEVVDRHKNKCDANETVVKVFKYDKKNYSYSIALECPSYKKVESAENNDQEGKITINATTPKEDKKVGDKTIKVYSYSKSEFNITLKDPDKIASYNYTIYLNDAETKNSGEIEGKLKTEIEFDVPLKNYLPGKVKIEVTMVDKFGNKTKGDKEISISNTEAPECKALSGQNKEYEWTNKVPVEVSVKCISKSDKGCQKDVFTQGYFKSTKTDNIKITDKENNSNNCPVNVYLDIDPPTTPIIKNDYDNVWTNLKDASGKEFDYTITVSASDETSGIAYFRYRYPDSNLIASDGKPESEWHIWEGSRQDVKTAKPGETITYTSTKFTRERGEVLEVQACDHANAKEVAQGNKDAVGNCSESATTIIKIDKTKPEISNISNPYLNVWFNKADYDKNRNAYVIKITSKDKTDDISKNETGISGIAYHSYRYSSTSWTEYANSGTKNKSGPVNRETYVFTTTPFTKDRDEKVYFQACDNAGNCAEGESYIMLDKTPPSVKVTNPFGSRWYKKSDIGSKYTVTSTATDATSGLANHDYKYSDSNSWTTKSLQGSKSDTIIQSQSIQNTNRSLSFKARDRAGNETSDSTSIRIDTTAPTCNISVSGTQGNNSWYISKPKLTLSHTDDYSGVACYGLGTSSNVSCGKTDSGTQSDTTGTTWYGVVKDVAGNETTCNSGKIKVDTTAPTCSISVKGTKGTSNWYTTNASIELSHTDACSGVACYGLGTSESVSCNATDSKTQKDTTGTTWYGIVTDNAGNKKNCNSGKVKVDTVAPSTPTHTSRYTDGSGTYSSGTTAKKTVSTTVSSTDATSGIEGIYQSQSKSGGSRMGISQNGTTWSSTVTWQFTSERNDTYYFRARDNAGNYSGWSSSFNIKYAKLYTISYNANNGSGAPGSQTKVHDVALTLSSTTPSRSGYKFMGWSTSSSDSTATYSAGGTYTSNSNATLYAVWKKLDSINASRCGSGNKYYITTCDDTICNYNNLNGSTSYGTVERNTINVCTITPTINAPSSAVCSGKQISLTCKASGGVSVIATIVDNGYTTGGSSATAYATLNTTRTGNIATTFICETKYGDKTTSTQYFTVNSCNTGSSGSTCTKSVRCSNDGNSETACKTLSKNAGGTFYHYGRGTCYAYFCSKCPSKWIEIKSTV